MTEQPALIVQDLSKRYGSTTVLSDFNLKLEPGQITSLLGRSGAGKSTLLRLIAGLETPSSGEIRAHTNLLSTPKKLIPPEKRGIGLVFQDFALFPNMTAAQNVMFGLKGVSTSEKTDIAAHWLDTLDMSKRADAYPHQLSGGEQQRVAIARAIAANPRAIMMDEPFSGLDPSNRDAVRDVALSAIRKAKIPALLVTHDPEEALAYADQVAILEEGRLLQTGSPDDVYLRPESQTVAKAFGSVYSIARSDLPTPWHAMISGAGPTLHYRAEALRISDDPAAIPIRIKDIQRVGAAHKIVAEFDSGLSMTFAAILNAPAKPDETVKIIPRPELFYAF